VPIADDGPGTRLLISAGDEEISGSIRSAFEW
jgi:hypothetical protein